MDKKQESEALFWAHVLHDGIHGHVAKGEMAEYLRRIREQGVLHPDGSTRHPAIPTLKRKLKLFGEASLDGLARKPRSDRGALRTLTPEALATLLAAKREDPRRGPRMLSALLKAKHGIEVPHSTLQRHLKANGVTRMRLGAIREPVRKRWTAEAPNAMWVGDFAHGPLVLVEGRAVKSRLSAFIDAHSRVIVAGRYYATERFDIVIDTLMRGFATHGKPRALYLDNGKVYWARSLSLACYRLGINLLHRPVRDPAAGGVIERFIQTVQMQFEVEVGRIRDLTLTRLNELFHAWLEEAYHRHAHSELKRTPLEAYEAKAVPMGPVDLAAIREQFHEVKERTVDRIFSDIALDNVLYRVDHHLRGEKVEVRYDPFGDCGTIKVYDLRSKAYLGEGVRHHRETGEKIRSEPLKPLESSPILDALETQHAKRMAQRDFRPELTKKAWRFPAFAACLAGLLGRRGSVSEFATHEMDLLQEVFRRHPDLTRKQVEDAVARAISPTLPAIIHALDQEE
jgi:transposase InsO family protein